MKAKQNNRFPAAAKLAKEEIWSLYLHQKDLPSTQQLDDQTLQHLAKLHLREHFRPHIFKETQLKAAEEGMNLFHLASALLNAI